MLTKNFKNIMATILILGSGTPTKGLLPVKDYNGTTYYVYTSISSSTYPSLVGNSFAASLSGTGISLGSGNTAATEEDYKLDSQITNGLNCAVAKNVMLDSSGNPCIVFDITATNVSSADITIREIGYRQPVNATTSFAGSTATAHACLIDRTVLDTPVTIPAGEYAVIRYTLKTIIGE